MGGRLPDRVGHIGRQAAGLPVLSLERRPNDLAWLQVAAAVGQGLLMQRYTDALASRGRVVGQVLLTRDVLGNRERYLNARRALELMQSSHRARSERKRHGGRGGTSVGGQRPTGRRSVVTDRSDVEKEHADGPRPRPSATGCPAF